MTRFALSMTLLCLALPGAVRAADASMCSSMCTQQKQECKAKVPRRVEIDRIALIPPEEKNPLARSATRAPVVDPDERSRERADIAKHTAERAGMCDDSYLRCTRACASPGRATGESEVIIRRKPDAGR